MAVTYTWDVDTLETKTEGSRSDVVVQTRWTKTGTDSSDNLTGKFNGATPFTAADVADADFVDYASLTKAKVLEWIQAVVINSYEEHVNEQIAKDIEKNRNPQTEQVAPWVTPSPPPG